MPMPTDMKANPMIQKLDELEVSTPGRVCLFGEHQDYLSLPVIPAAISLRIRISGSRRKDSLINIRMPDINDQMSFSLDGDLKYVLERDYFRSSINVLRRNGFKFSGGCDCTVHGEIPIRSGTSSSSALVVTWIQFLSLISDQQKQLEPDVRARYAHEAEVLEFGEPGGMMDQYSTSNGGILFIQFFPNVALKKLTSPLTTFVLGDSQEAKNTKSVLSQVKNGVLEVVRSISLNHSEFSLQSVKENELDRYAKELTSEQYRLLRATIRNRELTYTALKLLSSQKVDERKFGELLNEHHAVLRDVLKISTPKIERMLESALKAGAYGGKINGSGGGGCMFVYAPENPGRVAEAIKKDGGIPFIVRIDDGTKIEINRDLK
jgi:galactokinase